LRAADINVERVTKDDATAMALSQIIVGRVSSSKEKATSSPKKRKITKILEQNVVYELHEMLNGPDGELYQMYYC
jgi:hypothetical protein